jgi:hypothetical protein
MLGSNIDQHYRSKNFTIFREKFGSLLLEGEFKIIPNLLVNNNSVIGVKKDTLVSNYSFTFVIDEIFPLVSL